MPPPSTPASSSASIDATKTRLHHLRALLASSSPRTASTPPSRGRRRSSSSSFSLPCRYFLRGRCTASNCRFLHQRPTKLPRKLSQDDATRLHQLRQLLGQRDGGVVSAEPFSKANTADTPYPTAAKQPVSASQSEGARLNQLQALLAARKASSVAPASVRTKWIRKGVTVARTKPANLQRLRRRRPSPTASNVSKTVSINGVAFKLDASGRKMTRLDHDSQPIPAAESHSSAKPTFVPTHINVDGIAFVKSKGGKALIRSSMQNSRAQASSRLKRSLSYARNRNRNKDKRYDKREKEFCMFFNRFGKCKDGEHCVFLHDRSKVSVCRLFLAGKCFDESCLLSHTISREKMPVCSYFLRGMCDKGTECRYSHVRVNPSAQVCAQFLKGFCPDGDACKLKHMYPKQQRRSDTGTRKATGDTGSRSGVQPANNTSVRVIEDSIPPSTTTLRIRPRLAWPTSPPPPTSPNS